jgi:DNA-binding transcriptional LysR family regulator
MSLSQIETFVAVAEEQSISRAAKRLCISQPPVTRQIKSLEEELGGPLFRRTLRGVELLPAGAVFLVHARDILERVRQASVAVLDAQAPRR